VNILLINWQAGENNPFDFFNSKLIGLFQSLGCIASKIDLDESFVSNMLNHPKVDLVITFQGLGSNDRTSNGCNLWEEIKTPLVCLHGDHPSHMPLNHEVDNSYVHHIYLVPSFARYANILFNRSNPGIYYILPNFFGSEDTEYSRTGDYFVLPKNLDSIEDTFNLWKTTLKPNTSQFVIQAAKNIMEDYDSNIFKDHHATIDELLVGETFEKIKFENSISDEIGLTHILHRMLDKVYRNYASEQVVNSLKDYPLKIIGRGWDKFKNKRNKNHEYLEFDSLAKGGFQFYSSYGIIDITPAVDSFHDRMFNALSHKGGFISNSLLSHTTLLSNEYDSLFYRINSDSICNTVERVIESPKDHLVKCEQFSIEYNKQYSFINFYLFLVSFVRQR
jgi:hypothetical protein